MYPECWAHNVCQVYAASDIQQLALFNVKPGAPLPRDMCLLITPFGSYGVLACLHAEKEDLAISCPMAVLRW